MSAAPLLAPTPFAGALLVMTACCVEPVLLAPLPFWLGTLPLLLVLAMEWEGAWDAGLCAAFVTGWGGAVPAGLSLDAPFPFI